MIFCKPNNRKSRKFSKINRFIKRDYLCQIIYCDNMMGFLPPICFEPFIHNKKPKTSNS